ncbi:YlmH/Sll1252 family protein [Fusobacterium sp. MFO224]|uniref:YlmH/Sll1252 family protein n=1 Tax=Fusobacterium sp. MFO224 TaxID=3378070 RepID=UPI00385459B0
MNKKSFLSFMKDMDQDKVVKLWEDIELSERIDYPIQASEFYPPGIWTKLLSINVNGMTFLTKGLTEESEKKNILIVPKDYLGEIPNFNLIYFKIDGKNRFKNLLHKDFLGTIMSLGIKREILGDLIVGDSISYGVILEENFKIIMDIDRISNVPVKVEVIKGEEIPAMKYKDMSVSVISLRLDSVLSGILNMSRQKAVDEIVKGNVMVNYVINREKSSEIKAGDVLSIKKVGKFLVEKEMFLNKKGKLRIKLKKYI